MPLRKKNKNDNLLNVVDERFKRRTVMSEVMSRTLMGKLWHAFTALSRNTENHVLERSKAKVLTQSLVSVMQLSPTIMKGFEGVFPDTHYQEGITFDDYREYVTCHLLAKVILEENEDLCFENDAETEDASDSKRKEVKNNKEECEPECKEEKRASDSGEHHGSSSSVSPTAPAAPAVPSKDVSVKNSGILWDLLDNVCWTLYSKQALSPSYGEQLSEKALHLLWQWYVTFADTDAAGIVKCPVQMDCDELNFWLHYIFGELLALEFQPMVFQRCVSLAFNEVLDAILCMVSEKNIDFEEFEFVLKEFHMEMVDGVMRKGFLYKGKRNLMKSQWKRRYCVLTLKTFAYYTEENMTDKKGQIPLSQIISADPYRDRYSKLTRFQIETEHALFILEAEDLRSRNQWIRDIRYAIQCSRRQIENVNFLKAEKRNAQRVKKREKEKEEEEEKERVKARIQNAEVMNEELTREIESVKNELEKEERQRQEEEKARVLATQDLQAQLQNVTDSMTATMTKLEAEKKNKEAELEEERQRVSELQDLHAELEAALQEEQKLRRHEESVMRMQADLVQEQVAAREKLEAMRQEQEQLLEEEIQKRAAIQMQLADQNEKIATTEQQLEEYAQQLKQSETQKSELFTKLTTLEKKIQPTLVNSSHRGPGAFSFFKFS